MFSVKHDYFDFLAEVLSAITNPRYFPFTMLNDMRYVSA